MYLVTFRFDEEDEVCIAAKEKENVLAVAKPPGFRWTPRAQAPAHAANARCKY